MHTQLPQGSSDILKTRAEGPVLIVTLHRPQKLNAINYALADTLRELLLRLEADPEVRAVVLTGAGERAFSAGGDIPEFQASIGRGGHEALADFVERGQSMTSTISGLRKPVITAVNGLAYGGGCEIVEASHLSVAVEEARFAKPEVRIGIPPTFGGTQRLPRLAGRKRALYHLLTGEPFDAHTALELGLINEVVPRSQLMSRAVDLARRIVVHAPSTVEAILGAVDRGLETSLPEGLALEALAFARLAGSQATAQALSDWMGRRAASL